MQLSPTGSILQECHPLSSPSSTMGDVPAEPHNYDTKLIVIAKLFKYDLY